MPGPVYEYAIFGTGYGSLPTYDDLTDAREDYQHYVAAGKSWVELKRRIKTEWEDAP